MKKSNYELAKAKWFKRNILSYKIQFYVGEEEHYYYNLFQYDNKLGEKIMASYIYSDYPPEILRIYEFFSGLDVSERFYVARALYRRALKLRKSSHIVLTYLTRKQSQKLLKDMLCL